MSPLSAIAVSRLAGHTVAAAGRATTQAVGQFADILAGVTSGGEAATTRPSTHPAESRATDPARTLAGSIVDRIRQLLGGASLPTDQSLSLELSPLGGLFVSSESDQRGNLETALAHDAQLRDMLGRWSSLSGDRTFSYDPSHP